MADRDELLRLRHIIEDLQPRVDDLERRAGHSEREGERQAERCGEVERAVTGLVEENKIAAAVAARIKKQRAAMYSWPVKVSAVIVAGCAVVGGVSSLIHSLP